MSKHCVSLGVVSTLSGSVIYIYMYTYVCIYISHIFKPAGYKLVRLIPRVSRTLYRNVMGFSICRGLP